MAPEGWVLAGGQSRRMGQDKASLELGGVPLILHMVSKIRAIGLEARVAGLRQPVAGIAAEAAVPDRHSECGPLGGIETALHRSSGGLRGDAPVLLLGVDMPLIPLAYLRWMVTRAARTGALATVPRVLGRPQPLCAVYRRELGGAVTRALDGGEYKVMRAIEQGVAEIGGRLDYFDVECLSVIGAWTDDLPVHWQFLNCNTPEDRRLAEALLTRASG